MNLDFRFLRRLQHLLPQRLVENGRPSDQIIVAVKEFDLEPPSALPSDAQHNPNAISADLNPLEHPHPGAGEERENHPLFDPSFYLEHNPDVAATGVNPLEHYLRHGAGEGRDPNVLFDTSFYLERNPDVAAAGVNPLEHYFCQGAGEGRDPHPLFDTSFYLERNPDVAAAGRNPLEHYLHQGIREGRDPHPLFDTSFYLERNQDVAATGMNPLEHYLHQGAREGRDPNALFDTSFYLESNPDVAAAGVNPLEHYFCQGAREGRDPHALFATSFYLERNPDVAAAGRNPLEHYLHQGVREGCDPHPLFDTSFYLERNPDVAAAGRNPLEHYYHQGAREGRDPHPLFDTSFYLLRNPKVAATDLNPLEHYLEHGAREGRHAFLRVPGIATGAKQLFQEGQFDRVYDLCQLTCGPSPLSAERDVCIRATVKSVRAFLQDAGALLYENSPQAATIPQPSFCRQNEDHLPPIKAALPSEYVGCLTDVHVVGGTRIILTEDGYLLHDELSRHSPDFSIKPAEVVIAAQERALIRARRDSNGFIKEGILLSCDYDGNYFHWLVEVLPKLAFVNSLPALASFPLLIGESLAPNLIAALEVINQGRRPIIRLRNRFVYHVDKLIYPSDLSCILDRYHGTPDPKTDAVLCGQWIKMAVDGLQPQSPTEPRRPFRKLYLTRRSCERRVLRNEHELEALLLDRGFEIVEINGANFENQVTLFRQASYLVAPTGTAVTNLLFCRPQTKAIVLLANHPSMNYFIWPQLAKLVGVELRYFLGQRLYNLESFTVHDDYLIDLALFQEYLDADLAAREEAPTMERRCA